MTQKELQTAFNIPDSCITPCNKIHKVSENKVSFLLDRSKAVSDKFWCIQVDKCMITSDLHKKCDFAFIRQKKDNCKEFWFSENLCGLMRIEQYPESHVVKIRQPKRKSFEVPNKII